MRKEKLRLEIWEYLYFYAKNAELQIEVSVLWEIIMSKVKFSITHLDGTKEVSEKEMSQQEQDAFINYLDDHYKSMRTDDLR